MEWASELGPLHSPIGLPEKNTVCSMRYLVHTHWNSSLFIGSQIDLDFLYFCLLNLLVCGWTTVGLLLWLRGPSRVIWYCLLPSTPSDDRLLFSRILPVLLRPSCENVTLRFEGQPYPKLSKNSQLLFPEELGPFAPGNLTLEPCKLSPGTP